MQKQAWYFVGAATLEVVSIAGMLIVKHYTRKQAIIRKLEKLEGQLSNLQKQFEELRVIHKEAKTIGESRTQGLTAAIVDSGDDSDDEYFEITDDEDVPDTIETYDKSHYIIVCPQTLFELDEKLRIPNVTSLREALNELALLKEEFPNNSELLWRIGEAHQKLSVAVDDKTNKRGHIDEGITACELALKLNPSSANAQKWFTLLIAMRIDLQPLAEKIKDAVLFKNSLEKAFRMNPNDGLLHYVLGRFYYEAANMTWYERKAASLIFDEPPKGTFEEALRYCLKAERLLKAGYKETKLTIAKCQIALGKYEDAVDSLMKATKCRFDSLDGTVNQEINALLKKYSSYC